MDSSFALKFVDSTASSTSYVVHGLTSAISYWWRVKAHNAAAWGPYSTKRSFSALFTGVGDSREMPRQFALDQNYPNPFNPTTVISFQLPVSSDVRLVVYDLLGREVAVLLNEKRQAGIHTSTFDASSLGSGMYLYRLFARPAEGGQTEEFVQTRKLMLVK
jgi:hypothetical protein